MAFATWADRHPGAAPGSLVDRRLGGTGADGDPPACCARRLVAADMLVYMADLAARPLAALRTRFPHLDDVPARRLYLCDGCRAVLLREGVVDRADLPHDGRRTLTRGADA